MVRAGEGAGLHVDGQGVWLRKSSEEWDIVCTIFTSGILIVTCPYRIV
jgi:hypothetical protein